jgi:hypothetical protein
MEVHMFRKLLTTSLVTLLMLVMVGTAFAADPFSATGSVVSVGADSFEMDVEGTVYTVYPPEGFVLIDLQPGDTVEVVGMVEELVVTADSVVVVPEDEEEEEEEEVVEYIKDGFYCTNKESMHPVVQKIADKYGAEYAEVLAFFCGTDEIGHNGLGGIDLAYKTSQALDDGTTAADILLMKEEMGGWGKVWQQLGLVGNKSGEPDDDEEDSEMVEILGDMARSHKQENENKGKPANTGKPDHAGPPDHANNDKDKDKTNNGNKNKDKNNNKGKNKNKP